MLVLLCQMTTRRQLHKNIYILFKTNRLIFCGNFVNILSQILTNRLAKFFYYYEETIKA